MFVVTNMWMKYMNIKVSHIESSYKPMVAIFISRDVSY